MKFLITLLLSCLAVTAQMPARIGGAVAGERIVGLVTTVAGGGGGGDGLLAPYPETNLVNWLEYTGLENNTYPTRSIAANLDNTASSSTINSTLASLSTNQTLLLTNKTFWLTNGSDVSLQLLSGRTLRGADRDATILVLSNNLSAGSLQGYSRYYNNIYSGATRGSTNITVVSNKTDMHIGGSIAVCATNNWNFVHPYGYEGGTPFEDTYSDDGSAAYLGSAPGNRALAELVKVVSVSDGTNLTIWPPLSEDYTATPARIEYVPTGFGSQCQWAGLENLTIRLGYNQLQFIGSQNMWMSNVVVEIYGGDLPSVYIQHSHRVLIEHCTFKGVNSRASAIVPYVNHSGVRVVNNIFTNVYQAVLLVGRGANEAIAYNYVSAPTNSTTALISEFGSHGVHVHHNLWEGNMGFSWDADSIHGSGSHQLCFRNHFLGEVVGITTSGYGCIRNDSFQFNNGFVGNTLGYSGMAGWIYEEYAPGSISTNAIFAHDYSGFSSTVNTGRYARATAIIHANTHYASGSAVTQYDATRTTTLTNSYLFTNRPYFWGTNIPWPMVTNMNPAFWRAKTGTNSN